MKPGTFIFRKKWVHYLYRNNVIWIDIVSVCKALDLDENEELQYLGKHSSFNLVSREIDFHFSGSYSEKVLCIHEHLLYQWLEHLTYTTKAALRDVFVQNLYTELRQKVKFQFKEEAVYGNTGS